MSVCSSAVSASPTLPMQHNHRRGKSRACPSLPSALTDALTHVSVDLSNVSYNVLLPTWDYYFTSESYLPSKNSTLFLYIPLYRLKD